MDYSGILVTNRSMVPVGEPTIIILEAVNDRLETVTDFRGTTYLCMDDNDSVVRTCSFTFKNRGLVKIRDFVFEKAGVHRITVKNRNGLVLGWGNPIISSCGKPDCLLFWGDIHVHTEYSDGRGTPESNYRYARDVVGLDFCAMADHTRGFSDDTWFKYQVTSRQFNDRGRFVTLLGFEWSPPPGDCVPLNEIAGQDHINVYYANDSGPLIRHSYTREERPSYLYESLRRIPEQAITISHPHLQTNGTRRRDWTYFDKELEPVVEIYSAWSSSEMLGRGNTFPPGKTANNANPDASNNSVQDALRMGHRLGIVAGSDGHDGFAGRSRMHIPGYSPWGGEHLYYPGGLTAVYAPELSRAAVFQALNQRHCYGTTGQRIIVQFHVNDHQMGDEVEVATNGPYAGKVTVHGAGPIDRIEVVKDTATFLIHKGHGMDESFVFEDSSPISGTHFYYIRVTQKNGVVAWSSPIWVTGK